jgi:hypothetical protein
MSSIHRTGVRFGELNNGSLFDFSTAMDVTVPMMNAPYALRSFVATAPTTAPMCDSERDRAELAGTRMLIAEECFDAIVQMLIDAGLVSKGCAAVMLDRLSGKLLMHATGRTETQWSIRQPELLDQATRLSTKAAVLRAPLTKRGY